MSALSKSVPLGSLAFRSPPPDPKLEFRFGTRYAASKLPVSLGEGVGVVVITTTTIIIMSGLIRAVAFRVCPPSVIGDRWIGALSLGAPLSVGQSEACEGPEDPHF